MANRTTIWSVEVVGKEETKVKLLIPEEETDKFQMSQNKKYLKRLEKKFPGEELIVIDIDIKSK